MRGERSPSTYARASRCPHRPHYPPPSRKFLLSRILPSSSYPQCPPQRSGEKSVQDLARRRHGSICGRRTGIIGGVTECVCPRARRCACHDQWKIYKALPINCTCEYIFWLSSSTTMTAATTTITRTPADGMSKLCYTRRTCGGRREYGKSWCGSQLRIRNEFGVKEGGERGRARVWKVEGGTWNGIWKSRGSVERRGTEGEGGRRKEVVSTY